MDVKKEINKQNSIVHSTDNLGRGLDLEEHKNLKFSDQFAAGSSDSQ